MHAIVIGAVRGRLLFYNNMLSFPFMVLPLYGFSSFHVSLLPVHHPGRCIDLVATAMMDAAF